MTEVHSVQDKVYANPNKLFINHKIRESFRRAKNLLDKSNGNVTETTSENRNGSNPSNEESDIHGNKINP
jgi:hypothetical protein